MSSSIPTVIPTASRYCATERLIDGREIVIRAIRPDDKQLLLQHFNSLSQRSIYYRFSGFKRSLTDADLRTFTELDFAQNVGLAATLGRGVDESFIGVGRYAQSEDSSRAEIAFAVIDSYQGQGIGTLLLKHLSQLAYASGIKEFTADVLGSNQQMLEVFANSGFHIAYSNHDGTVRVVLNTNSLPSSPML